MIEISRDDAQRIIYFLKVFGLQLRQTSFSADSYRADTVDGLAAMLEDRLLKEQK